MLKSLSYLLSTSFICPWTYETLLINLIVDINLFILLFGDGDKLFFTVRSKEEIKLPFVYKKIYFPECRKNKIIGLN